MPGCAETFAMRRFSPYAASKRYIGAGAEMLLWIASSCTLILDDEIADKLGSAEAGDTGCVPTTFWFDSDRDGFGDVAATLDVCELPLGYAENPDDCDDTAPAVNPAVSEVCDTIDNDCDGTTDQSAVDAPIWYQDLDLDTFGNDAESLAACAQPEGYAATGGDCDDLDSSVTIGETYFIDADGDTWGSEAVVACQQPADAVLVDGDCDDADNTIYPDAPELCNGLDDDCDTETDEEAIDFLTWYADHDGDGYGIEGETAQACEPPEGFVELSTDCDDTSAVISPDGVETCSGLDEDCDGLIDADDPDIVGLARWYLDADGDGHGDAAQSQLRCTQPVGYVPDGDDCDDTDANTFPGADETCDGADEDCDGNIDESAIDAAIWYADTDGDGYGDARVSLTTCEQPVDYADNSDDCDDTDAATSPEGIEACDGFDQDCDGSIDEQLWYADADDDGYGDADTVNTTCIMPSGFVANGSDCDDSDAAISPDAVEVCGGTDEDCDGLTDDLDDTVTDQTAWYADADGDTWGAGSPINACVAPVGTVATDEDCDNTDAAISPEGTEVCGGADEDCDTLTDDDDPSVVDAQEWYLDADGDGFGASSTTEACLQPGGYSATGDDCDDTDGSSSPAGVETCDDGTDQDCDGSDLACSTGNYTTAWGSEMIAISAGSFTMGGGAGDPAGSYTDHVVTLTRDFWIGQTEITQVQWESYAANVGWPFTTSYPCTTSTTTDDCPADTISWYDVAKYANALSAQEGLTACYLADGTDLAAAYLADPYACPGYRMPTEAEWEYAARAGQDTEFSGSNTATSVAWYRDNAYSVGTYAHQVATLAPNAWGLYDMSGNVWEWTNDWYSSSYGGYGTGAAQTDPVGPTSGSDRVFRGSNWSGDASCVRVAYRYGVSPVGGNNTIGARLSRSNP